MTGSALLSFTHQENKISLNSGEVWAPPASGDTYRDAPAGELWDIVKAVRGGIHWRDVVTSRYAKAHPWLHRIVTSPQRDLFFRQHPPQDGARVLDIGSGWGQTALPLARAGCQVVALEPTPERLAFVHAAATQDKISASMHFLQADFFDVGFATPFDLVTCIGVLEWTPKFRSGDPYEIQLDFLRRARRFVAPGGKFVLGIENRLGLKYLLGAPDDHIGVAGIAVLDRALAAEKWLKQSSQLLRSYTFTRAELASLLAEAGFSQVNFFSAFPDYKVPETILPLGPETENFLGNGGFVEEHDGCNGQPLPIQAELRSHYHTFAQLGIASNFVPSFFVQASA